MGLPLSFLFFSSRLRYGCYFGFLTGFKAKSRTGGIEFNNERRGIFFFVFAGNLCSWARATSICHSELIIVVVARGMSLSIMRRIILRAARLIRQRAFVNSTVMR